MRLANLQLTVGLKNFNYAPSPFGLIALLGMLIAPVKSWAQLADSKSSITRAVDAVCNKQIVVLGELLSHGESKAFQAKAQIIEQLVNRCGFDALLFEAHIYNFFKQGSLPDKPSSWVLFYPSRYGHYAGCANSMATKGQSLSKSKTSL